MFTNAILPYLEGGVSSSRWLGSGSAQLSPEALGASEALVIAECVRAPMAQAASALAAWEDRSDAVSV